MAAVCPPRTERLRDMRLDLCANTPPDEMQQYVIAAVGIWSIRGAEVIITEEDYRHSRSTADAAVSQWCSRELALLDNARRLVGSSGEKLFTGVVIVLDVFSVRSLRSLVLSNKYLRSRGDRASISAIRQVTVVMVYPFGKMLGPRRSWSVASRCHHISSRYSATSSP